MTQGLAESRTRAQALILAGAVTVDGCVILKAAESVEENADIAVHRPEDEYVSRGALKLVAAIDAFDISVAGCVAADIGASTGGFTDVLLRNGAQRVYAIDVGYGQFAWRLRHDPRVVLMERTNFRFVESLPEPVALATVDVSFISLTLILPVLSRLMSDQGETIALIKPQFEAGRERVGKGGVVRDSAVHRDVLRAILDHAAGTGWGVMGLIESPITGPAGNHEFLAHLRWGSPAAIDPGGHIETAVRNG